MKKIIVAGLIASLFLVGLVQLRVVSANDEPNGNPFQAILDAITELQTNLQEQINNIELTPGPQGPQGLQGEQGLPGSPAPTIKIIDANGTLIGYPAFSDGSEGKFIVYDPTLRALEKPNVLSGQIEGIGEPVQLQYATSDCSGQAYARNIGGPLPLLWRDPDIGATREFYLPDRTKSVASKNTYLVQSRKNSGSGCIVVPAPALNSTPDFPVNQIVLPYISPFDIVVQ